MRTLIVLALLGAGAFNFAPTQSCSWAAVTTHVDGTPVVVAGYELAIVSAVVNLNTAGAVPLAVVQYGPDAWTGLGLAPLLNGRPSGTYRLQARAQSASGVWSAWSVPFDGVWDVAAPAAPTGLSVK